jgi:hypothetical protein
MLGRCFGRLRRAGEDDLDRRIQLGKHRDEAIDREARQIRVQDAVHVGTRHPHRFRGFALVEATFPNPLNNRKPQFPLSASAPPRRGSQTFQKNLVLHAWLISSRFLRLPSSSPTVPKCNKFATVPGQDAQDRPHQALPWPLQNLRLRAFLTLQSIRNEQFQIGLVTYAFAPGRAPRAINQALGNVQRNDL